MDYQNALEQAIIYIEDHLSDDIKVDDVAHFAGYSYYHLNRQFTAILGESVGSYIKKRRLANAAEKLLYTNQKIIDIAMEHNFESAEAFSRAFKQMYKSNPKEFRKNRIHTFVATKQRMNEQLFDHLLYHVSVHPKIVQLAELKVVGLRQETSLQVSEIKVLWEMFYQQLEARNEVPVNIRKYGIYELYAKDNHYTINGDLFCSEVFCVDESVFSKVPNDFVHKVIPGGRYAVFTHRGSLATMSRTIDFIWGTWLLTTKEEVVDDRETFEFYDERFLGFYHPDSEIDVYVPIR